MSSLLYIEIAYFIEDLLKPLHESSLSILIRSIREFETARVSASIYFSLFCSVPFSHLVILTMNLSSTETVYPE